MKFFQNSCPNYDLTKKVVRFERTVNCENAFHELKIKLTSAPVITILDPDYQFCMLTHLLLVLLRFLYRMAGWLRMDPVN